MGSGALVTAIGTCLLGSFLPWINVEVVVVGSALVLPHASLPLLVLGGAAAQMVAKGSLYLLARRAPQHLPARLRGQVKRLPSLAGRRRTALATVLASSSLSIPPFYLVALACGTLAIPFESFLAAGFAGMLARYAVLVGAATALGGLLP